MTLQVPNSYAYVEAVTISDTAKSMTDLGFTEAQLLVANQAIISVVTDAVRWRKDGGTPTASLGHYLAPNSTPLVIIGNADIQRLEFIRVTTDAALYVELEK